jgi:hypothetical protein
MIDVFNANMSAEIIERRVCCRAITVARSNLWMDNNFVNSQSTITVGPRAGSERTLCYLYLEIEIVALAQLLLSSRLQRLSYRSPSDLLSEVDVLTHGGAR